MKNDDVVDSQNFDGVETVSLSEFVKMLKQDMKDEKGRSSCYLQSARKTKVTINGVVIKVFTHVMGKETR